MRVENIQKAGQVSTIQERYGAAAKGLAKAIAGKAIPAGASAATLKKLLDKAVDLESLVLDDATWNTVRMVFEYSLTKERAVNGLTAYRFLLDLAAGRTTKPTPAQLTQPDAPAQVVPTRPKTSAATDRRAAYAFASAVLKRSVAANESAATLRAALTGKWVNIGDLSFKDRQAGIQVQSTFEYAMIKEKSLDAVSAFDYLLGK